MAAGGSEQKNICLCNKNITLSGAGYFIHIKRCSQKLRMTVTGVSLFATRRSGESGAGSCASPQRTEWPTAAVQPGSSAGSSGQPARAAAGTPMPLGNLLEEEEDSMPAAGVHSCSTSTIESLKKPALSSGRITLTVQHTLLVATQQWSQITPEPKKVLKVGRH